MAMPSLHEIRAMRMRLGMTQASLARACGLSQSIIAKIEKGHTDASYSTATRIFDYFEAKMSSGGRKASDIMSRAVVSATPKEKVSSAILQMRKKSLSALPVVDGGRAVGSISDDTIMGHLSEGKQVAAWECGRIMDEPFPRVSPDTPSEAVGSLLKYSKAVLVTSGDKVEGIITKADMLKLIRP